MRTVFVNPSPSFSNPRRKKRGKKRSKRRGRARSRRRNAGIVPFVSNPLIMSNPPRRKRRRRSNPLAGLNIKNLLGKGLTYGGGAAIAVGANTLLLNSISNFWVRNGARFGGAIASTMFMKGELGAATAGAMFYPLMQEVAAKFLGTGATGTEADLEGLAADLEDVMDDLDERDLSDDDEISDDDLLIEDDEDNILS